MENEVQSIEISKDINIGEVVITLINESIQMINQSLNITFMYEGDISVLLANLNECNSIVYGEDVYNDYNVIKEFGFKYDNEERQIFKVVLNQPEKEYELPNDVLTAIDYAVQNMYDDQALNCMSIFPLWKEGVTYSEGNRVQYKDKLYKVLQDHTSQSDWTPDTSSSLYVGIADPNIEYPEFVQPTGAHDAYAKGDKVTFEGKKYVSLIDANTWSPVSYPSGWERSSLKESRFIMKNNIFDFVDSYNTVVGAIIAFLTIIFGEHWYLFALFLLLNVIDWFTGWMKSNINHKTNSNKGWTGVLKKLGYWIMIIFAFAIAAGLIEIGNTIGIDLGVTTILGWFVLASLIVNEARSIIENFVEAGYNVPKILTNGLEIADKMINKDNVE